MAEGDSASVVAAIEDLHPTRIFHLATHFVGVHKPEDISALVKGNVEFGTAVAEGASRSGAVLIYTASAWQRFRGSQSSVSLYAALKESFSDVLTYYEEVEGTRVQQVFLFDTYGPSDMRGKLVSRLLRAARDDLPVTLGSPGKLINLTHADDVVSGLVLSASSLPLRRDWVIRAQESVTLAELVDLVSTVSGRKLAVEWNPDLDRPREMFEEWRFGEVVPLTCRTSLVDGLDSLWTGQRK